MLHGSLRVLSDDVVKRRAFDALVNAVATERADNCRRPNTRELAATALLAFEIEQATYKTRPGGVVDEPEDLALPYWAGVIPLRTTPGDPIPADDLAPELSARAAPASYWPTR